MTKAEAKAMLKRIQEPEAWEPQINQAAFEALDMAIEALEPKPYEKFESAKDHIYKLAGDYKCWDNRLTKDEAVELCHILEQQPCEDTISRQAAIDALNDVSKHYTDKGREWHPHVNFMIDAIKELPSAQPEIIRCKDCNHWDGVDTCDVIDAPVWDNDFCSMAERRSNE